MIDGDYMREAEHRARRFSGAYTGTSGTLAADVIRLINHIKGTTMDANHILRGAAELQGKLYTGDDMPDDSCILTEDDVADLERETGRAADIGGNVFPSPEEACRPGTDKFLAVLREIADLHISKSLDYGQDEDALANIRAGAEAINVPAWLGCVLRMSDKMQRIRAFCRRGRCEHDGIEDTLLDIAAYAAIALVVYREQSAPPTGSIPSARR